MKLAATGRRVVPLIVTLAVWILTGSLALAETSDAATTFSLRSDSCVPAQICASMPATSPAFVIGRTGPPDGRMAIASRPGNGSPIEIEAADDFIVTGTVRIDKATFTGLLPGGAPLTSIQDVQVEIYRVFPLDSVNPPSGNVPTRANSPSDIDFVSRAQSSGDLSFIATVLSSSFNASNSVVNGINPKPNQTTGGEGPVTGEEVQFDVTLTAPIVLAEDHYFFVPKVQLSSGNFLWLSAAGPILFTGDLQAWIRNANLDPDWLRVGMDIVGGATPPKFNGSFSLTGARLLFLPAIFR
jgi:hypothetical protein